MGKKKKKLREFGEKKLKRWEKEKMKETENKQDIIQKVEEYVGNNLPKSRLKEAYLRHIYGVREYAVKLAKIYNQDKIIIEIAALLHDIGADAGKVHAEESAKLAEKFLYTLNLNEEQRKRILECIARHSMGCEVNNPEQQIIQDADGIFFVKDSYKEFFENKLKTMDFEEAKELAIKKTKGMMDKIKTEEGVKIAKQFLNKSISYLQNLKEK